MTLREILAELIEQSGTERPTANALLEHFRPKAKQIMTAGPMLKTPAWTSLTTGANDTYLDLEGDVAGLHLREDDQGCGAYAVLAVTKGTLADVEAVVGVTNPVTLGPGLPRPDIEVSAHVKHGDRTIRVFTRLVKRGPDVKSVTVHFER